MLTVSLALPRIPLAGLLSFTSILVWIAYFFNIFTLHEIKNDGKQNVIINNLTTFYTIKD